MTPPKTPALLAKWFCERSLQPESALTNGSRSLLDLRKLNLKNMSRALHVLATLMGLCMVRSSLSLENSQ